jgi:hypothetical protein
MNMEKFYIEPEESEREYRELSRLGAKLRIPIPECFLEMKVVMPNGEVIHHHKQRSHSWTRNAYNVIFGQVAGTPFSDATFAAGKLSMKSTGAVVKTSATRLGGFSTNANLPAINDDGCIGGAGDDTRGIQVGSNNTAESFEDFVINTIINNGAAGGQISYTLQNATVVSYVAGTKTLSAALARYFNNNSGGAIDVKEVTLGTLSSMVGSAFNSILTRDVLPVTVTVPNTGQLKVTYTISLVYPA